MTGAHAGELRKKRSQACAGDGERRVSRLLFIDDRGRSKNLYSVLPNGAFAERFRQYSADKCNGEVLFRAPPSENFKQRTFMAIETKVQPRQTWQNIAYAVLCLVFGIWGWYDYAIKIPRKQADFDAYVAAERVKADFEKLVQTTPLTEAQKGEFKIANEVLNSFKDDKPAEPAAYDRPVQLWLYIVGCGVLGVPWFIWAQWQLTRRSFRLDDDGTFHAVEGSFPPEQITGIDMSKWMAKSTATVETAPGVKIVLDDYKYKGVEDIVAALAARFYPGEWTSDARPIGDPKSRDTKRAASDAAAAEQSAEAAAPNDSTGA